LRRLRAALPLREILREPAFRGLEPRPKPTLELVSPSVGEGRVRASMPERRRVALMTAVAAIQLGEHHRRRRARTSIFLLTPCSIVLSFVDML
jgi:hypothetical protein